MGIFFVVCKDATVLLKVEGLPVFAGALQVSCQPCGVGGSPAWLVSI